MSEGAALLDGLPGGLFGDVLGLHLWGLVFSATIGEALKGARESPIELRARPLLGERRRQGHDARRPLIVPKRVDQRVGERIAPR